MRPRENDIETHLQALVTLSGGEMRKIRFLDRKGAPDRYCMWPQFPGVWVELKRPGGPGPTKRQRNEHKALRRLGQTVIVLYSYEDVEDFIERHCK